jgi:hypothetical protein
VFGLEPALVSALDKQLRASPDVMAVLAAARAAGLPDWRLFSGAIYQTVWNAWTGRPAHHGIRDYDIGYFDPDLTEAAERAKLSRVVANLPGHLSGAVEVVNQAGVHLWFSAKFGRPYAALANTDDALRRSLATAHAVGVRLEPDDTLSIAAPYGLRDIFDLVLRPNPDLAPVAAFFEKARDAVARWPEVRIVTPPPPNVGG